MRPVAAVRTGRDVPLVDVNTGHREVWTGTAAPRDNEGKLRNLAEASLYFALKENHLAIIQALGFGLSELQAYFQWLLGIDLAPPGTVPRLFHFRNIPSESARQAIAGSNISGITFGSNLFSESKIPTVVAKKGGGSKTVNRTEYVIDSSARAILKTVMDAIGMNDSPILDNLDHHADPGSIRMNVSITYASRSTKDAQELMHAIAGGLDDGDFPKASIRLKGGKTIRGEELTIRDSIKLQTVSGNPVVDHALSALTTWLIDQIREGKIV